MTPAQLDRLRRFEVVDRELSGRPVVALAGVVPVDWDLVSSTVSYEQGRSCPVMSVTTRFQVASPDRTVGLELFPAAYSVWFDDPAAELMYGTSPLAGGGCERGPVLDAPTYVRHRLLPENRTGGVVVAVEPLPALRAMLEQRARRVSSRNTSLRALHVDVTLVTVIYPDHGTEERILVPTVLQGQTFDPRGIPGPPQQWASYRPFSVGMWAPAGTWEEQRPAYELVMGSLMQDTDWLDKQTQLNVAMGRTTTKAARDRRLVWDATVDLANPTLLGALRDRQTGTDPFPVSLWTGGGARYALPEGVRGAWLTPDGELVVRHDDETPDQPGLRALRPGAELSATEQAGASDHDGATRLAAPRGGTLSASSDTSLVAPTQRSSSVAPQRSILAQPGGIATPD